MRRELIYLTIVFISIVALSIFINYSTLEEPFVILNNNTVLIAIDDVKNAFRNIETAAEEQKKKEIQTPTETKLVSYVVNENIKNLDVLAATYESMDEYNIDPVSAVNSIQANLNAYIEIYNYMNGKINLGLEVLKTNIIVVPSAQLSAVEFNQKLSLTPKELNNKIDTELTKKIPTTISAKLPVQSALHPPPQLIKIYKAPPEKKEIQQTREIPIFDIYDQLIKVYGPIN